MKARGVTRFVSPTVCDALRVVTSFMTVAGMLLRFAVVPPVAMETPSGFDMALQFAPLCGSHPNARSDVPDKIPIAPVGPVTHDTCLACQCLWPALATLSGGPSLVTVFATWRSELWIPRGESRREPSLIAYYSRAPPSLV